jgi:DNA replication protein DnaC
VLEQLYSIVNARYQDERSTLITSNLGRDELAEQLGERIVSRLEGSCELLPFYGTDARRVDFRPARPRADTKQAPDPPLPTLQSSCLES